MPMNQQQHKGSGHNINANRDVNIYVEQKHLSLLAAIVNILGKRLYIDSPDDNPNYTSFDIDRKIDYNSIKGYKMIIDEHKIYVGKLSVIYQEFDNEGTNKTQITLSNIRTHYLKTLMEYRAANEDEDTITVVRRYSDQIIQDIEEKLLAEIQKSTNITETVDCINVSLQIIIVDALMRCKILEKPQ